MLVDHGRLPQAGYLCLERTNVAVLLLIDVLEYSVLNVQRLGLSGMDEMSCVTITKPYRLTFAFMLEAYRCQL